MNEAGGWFAMVALSCGEFWPLQFWSKRSAINA